VNPLLTFATVTICDKCQYLNVTVGKVYAQLVERGQALSVHQIT